MIFLQIVSAPDHENDKPATSSYCDDYKIQNVHVHEKLKTNVPQFV